MGVLIVACTEAFSSLPPHVPSCELAFQELDQDANKLITRSDTNSFDGGLKKAVMEELQLANGTINFAQFAVKYCEGQNIAPKYAARWSSFLDGGQDQDAAAAGGVSVPLLPPLGTQVLHSTPRASGCVERVCMRTHRSCTVPLCYACLVLCRCCLAAVSGQITY